MTKKSRSRHRDKDQNQPVDETTPPLPLLDRLERVAAHRLCGPGLGAIYSLSLIVVGLLFHVSGDAASESDFFGPYVKQAQKFLEGTIVIDHFRGPLYPMALGSLYLLLSLFKAGLFETGIVLSAISAGLAIGVSHRVLQSLFSGKLALVVTVLLATNPIFIRYSYTAGNDMFFLAVALIGVHVFLRVDKPRWPWLVASGALAALAYLIRYNGVSILLAMIFGLVFVNVWRTTWKDRLLSTVVLTMTFVAVITPWALYCKNQKGQFFYNQNYVNVALGLYSADGDADRFLKESPTTFDSFADVISHDPKKFFTAFPERALRHVSTMIYRVILFPLGSAVMLGMLLLLVRPPSRREASYYMFGLIYFAVIVMVFFGDRFFLLLIPMAITVAARGLFELADIVKSEPRAQRGLVIIVVGLIAINATAAFLYNKKVIAGETIGFRDLGRQFRESVPEERLGKRVVARMPYFAYFAGLEHVRLPILGSEAELLAFMRKQAADYLFFSYAAKRTRGELADLMDPRAKPTGLKVVAVSSLGVLYQIDDRGPPNQRE
jgi:hypothetical protein